MRTNGVFHGLLTGIALIVYFLLMKLLGLEENFSLRLFNFVIVVGGIYYALRSAIVKSKTSSTYFQGLITGFRTTLVAVALFTIFMAVYVKVIDPSFVKVLEESGIWDADLSLAQAAFAVVIEGVTSGVVISFVWMQRFKKDLPQLEEEQT